MNATDHGQGAVPGGVRAQWGPALEGPAPPRWLTASLWLLLGLGVFLRCTRLDLMEFKNDELYFLELARHNAADLGSVRSTEAAAGLPHPPGISNFLTLTVLWNDDPLVVAASIVLLNLAALGIYYAFLRGLFGGSVALWGTALFASMPWAVVFSRKISSADIIFPFAIAFYWLLFSTMRRYRPWKVYLTFFSLALLLQTHISAWFLAPPLLAFALVLRIRFKPRDLAVGVGIVLLVFVPYFLDLLQLDPTKIRLQARSPIGFELLAGNVVQSLKITTGLGFERLFGDGGHARLVEQHSLGWTLWVFRGWCVLALAALGLYLVWAARYVRRFRRESHTSAEGHVAVLMALVFLCVMATFVLTKKSAVPHHVIVVYPVFPLLAVLLMHRLQREGRTGPARAVQAAVLVAVLTNLYFVHSYITFVGDHPEQATRGKYGLPYSVRVERWTDERWERWRDRVRQAGAERASRRR